MKSIVLITMLLFFSICVFAQKDSIRTANSKDTTRISLGKNEIQIIDTEKGTDIKVRKKAENEKKSEQEEFTEKRSGLHSGGFKGHWAGIEFGLNNYVTKTGSLSLPQSIDYMSLRTSRSINFNLNFFQRSFGIIGNQVGIVTGMGMEFLNYFFQNSNSIERGIDINGNNAIINKPYEPIDVDKSKLSMTYLTVPLILEIQFPGHLANSKRIHIAGGIIGGIKLRSHTKIVYTRNGDNIVEKNWDDFYLNSLRYGFTARVGYKYTSVFCNYYPTTLFQKGKGPELYPISVGISLTGF